MKTKPLVVYPDADGDEETLYAAEFDRIRQVAELLIYRGRPASHAEYIGRINNANGLLLGWDLPGDVMAKAGKLEMICFTGTGAAKFVDLTQAGERGISVYNCPGYASSTVAEHTMALLLSLTRKIPELNSTLKKGQWETDVTASELRGKNIGLIGFGEIGQYVAGLCRAFGMRVYVWTRSMDRSYESRFGVTLCDLSQLYNECGIISLHLASCEQTRNIIDSDAFAAMSPGTLFINTARAELVDEDALIAALHSGQLAAAALDVFHAEPLPRNHPLTNLDNVVLTPHVGYNTPESTRRLFQIAADNIIGHFGGRPVNAVTRNQNAR